MGHTDTNAQASMSQAVGFTSRSARPPDLAPTTVGSDTGDDHKHIRQHEPLAAGSPFAHAGGAAPAGSASMRSITMCCPA